jgi:hypothetical protein
MSAGCARAITFRNSRVHSATHSGNVADRGSFGHRRNGPPLSFVYGRPYVMHVRGLQIAELQMDIGSDHCPAAQLCHETQADRICNVPVLALLNSMRVLGTLPSALAE